jgi:mono/diheme cytochrome c family protein
MTMTSAKTALVLLCFAAACGQEQSDNRSPPEDTAMTAAQETVAVAQARYDPAAFAAVPWVDDSAHFARGAEIFRWVCAECHGPVGKGDGGAVLHGDTIHPPSFLDPDWRFANDEEGLRRRIFVGNARGMPHFGLRRMLASDIVAVEKYILFDLRPSQGVPAPATSDKP